MILAELTFRLPNSPGALADVCQVLAAERVRVIALMLDPQGRARLVVDNPVRASGALREAHHAVDQHDVLVASVPVDPAALAVVLKLVADAGVNLDYVYSGGPDASGQVSIVLGVGEPQRAASLTGL